MTLIWLLIWFVWDLVGDDEPLLFDPVNFWTGTLILAIGLDLGSLHAAPGGRAKNGERSRQGVAERGERRRRTAPGGMPMTRLNARAKAASER
jgi:hypothetical protein